MTVESTTSEMVDGIGISFDPSQEFLDRMPHPRLGSHRDQEIPQGSNVQQGLSGHHTR